MKESKGFGDSISKIVKIMQEAVSVSEFAGRTRVEPLLHVRDGGDVRAVRDERRVRVGRQELS